LRCSGQFGFFWWRWLLLFAGTALILFAHTIIETPAMQYSMWAHDESLDPHSARVHNLLDAQSSILGWLSMTIAMSLNVFAVLSTGATLLDGLSDRNSEEQ
jgi:hypothetical protein